MNNQEKKDAIKSKVEQLLNASMEDAKKQIDKAINSGALDIDSWDPNTDHWILPKTIATAILENESSQYLCKGSRFEKQIRKEANNLKLFL